MRTIVSIALVALAPMIDPPLVVAAQPEHSLPLSVTISSNDPQAVARILRARAYSTGSSIVIRGDVGFPSRVRNGVFSGHVDAQIRAADGTEFTLHTGKVRGRPKPGVYGRRGAFTINVEIDMPAGRSVFVSYVEARHRAP